MFNYTAYYREMIKKAYEVQQNAYAPYSNFAVGACLIGRSGKMYTGCNVESATYTPSSCAERTAFVKAISEGEQKFHAIAIVGNTVGTEIGNGDFCPPCGVCRQVMAEFCDPKTFEVILAKDYNNYKIYTLDELMPLVVLPNKN